MSNEFESKHDRGVAVEEVRPEVKPPPMYKVVLLNDDFTPMDFVVDVIQTFFAFDHDRATQIMLHVHTRGKGVCGIFTFEIAETKVAQVNEYCPAQRASSQVRPGEGLNRSSERERPKPVINLYSTHGNLDVQ